MQITAISAIFFGLLCAMTAAPSQADEPCTSLQFSMAQDTARELRAIAAQCESQPVADLYYHRAHHRELIGLNRTLKSVLTINPAGIPQNSVESYRLYMALVELMAEQLIEENGARVTLLNHQYARLNDLFELRLKGFDRLADRKEWQIYTH